MIRLGAPSSVPSGVSIELSAHGTKVVLRAWSPYDSIPAVHIPIEEFARGMGMTIPSRKPAAKPRSFPAAKRRTTA